MIALVLTDILVALGVFAILTGVAFLLVRKVRDNRWKIVFSLSVAIFTIIFFIFHLLYPWINYSLIRPFYIWKVEYILIACGGVILVTIRFMQCKNRAQKILISVLGAILILLATTPFSLRPFMHIFWNNRKMVIKNGIVLQQSGYSCGAGALATVLRMKGFNNITEKDAVIALRIVPVLGTEPDCVPPAIRRLTLGKYDAQVRYCPLDRLKSISMPCITTLKHRGLIGHYVAILEVQDDNVIIGDPLSGIIILPKAGLAKKWKNTVIELRQTH